MNRKWVGSFLIIVLLVFGGWMFFNSPFSTSKQALPAEVKTDGTSILDIGNQKAEERPVKTFSLTAQEKEWRINADKQVEAWTYNGTVPGKPLRVTEGDFVKVHLKNELSVPVTIHWHGMILPNQMDGVPGLTQDAVQPGESFTYEFIANDAGTYWYHSHQHSSKQVDKGLYGSLIIEEKDPAYQKEQIFMLDEWAVDQEKQSLTNMGGMMMGSMSGDGEADTKQMYDTLTVNGKSGNAIEPLQMEAGETARLRFINAGYQQHRLVFPEGSMEVIAADGEKVVTDGTSSNMLEIAPGERIDVAFTRQGEETEVIGEDPTTEYDRGMKIPVVSEKEADSFSYDQLSISSAASQETGTSNGSEELLFKETPESDVTYHMDLSMGMDMGEGMSFQINNKVFPDTPLIPVSEGDVVKVRITNSGRLNHPMHLHGHRFQVASKDGQAYENPIVKDLIHVKPGEEYTVYFKADNKGEWLFHCHDNNHADRGMVTIVDYQGVYSPFKLDGEHSNQP
ncbi:multicopper oxidase family protein [Halobacillus halophilus]|uniref:multicopper oxidase family protein n=1 Tax=Halobacillus halophilus TaxID=1570 RepID=UPI001CD3BA43|nr:multicopper oxidase family protein [Halobacillus halophilus]MCA1010762.1 multicopper oxidase family protein [Halobacillus halophilus]